MNANIENAKVLVTGGAGFIGSNLVDALLKQNNEVVVLDDFSTGKRENLKPYLANTNFTLLEGDIRNLDDCHQACTGMDYILHQAALGSVPRSIKDPILTHSVNCTGFLNMLTAARDAKVKRFVYAASSSTYGDHPGLPKVEDKIGRPLSPYAVTKYSNELYADVFYKTYGLEVIGLRYFNVFGRRQDPDGAYAAVIPKFIKAILASEAVTINGDGSSSRDFTYIDNVTQANQRAALSSSAESVNQVYNVACGGNVTVLELFETLQRLLQEKVPGLNSNKPLFGPERLGDVQHSTASIEKIMRLLGYSPTDDFHTGIQQTIDWYFKNSK